MFHLVQHRVHPKVLQRPILLENNIFCQINHWEHLKNYICSPSKECFSRTEFSSEIENTPQDTECCVSIYVVENTPQYSQCSGDLFECKITPIDNECSVTYTNMNGDCNTKMDLSTSIVDDGSVNSQSCDTTCDVNDLYTGEGGRAENSLILNENGELLSTKIEVLTNKAFSSSKLNNSWTLVKRRRNSRRQDNHSKWISKLSFQDSEVVVKKTDTVLPKETSKAAALKSEVKVLRYPVSRFTKYSHQLLDKDISGLKAKDCRQTVSHPCIENETEESKLQANVEYLPSGKKRTFVNMDKEDCVQDKPMGYSEDGLMDKKKIKVCCPRQNSVYIPMKSSIGWNHGSLLLVLLLCVMAVQRSHSQDQIESNAMKKCDIILTTAILITAISPPSSGAQPCRTGFELHGGKCYKLIHQRKTRRKAREECAKLGADLAEARSPAEHNVLSSVSGGKHVWLGLKMPLSERVWRWGSDNSMLEWSKWDVGQPGGGTSQRCVYYAGYLNWRNAVCTSIIYPLCQYDMTWGETSPTRKTNHVVNGGVMPDLSTLLVAVISVYYLCLVCMD